MFGANPLVHLVELLLGFRGSVIHHLGWDDNCEVIPARPPVVHFGQFTQVTTLTTIWNKLNPVLSAQVGGGFNDKKTLWNKLNPTYLAY